MSYSSQLFIFKLRPLNPLNLLTVSGVSPVTHPLSYSALYHAATIIIIRKVQGTAQRLNRQLVMHYRRDMSNIEEYTRFPRYLDIMRDALSASGHIGVEINKFGIYQARFVNSDLLGDLGMLQEIQQAAYQRRGTLEQWVGIYNKWLSGLGSEYSETINRRLDIMSSMKVAPFWELIEWGNQMYRVYPVNAPMLTLFAFRGAYIREMIACYYRCIAEVRLLAMRVPK